MLWQFEFRSDLATDCRHLRLRWACSPMHKGQQKANCRTKRDQFITEFQSSLERSALAPRMTRPSDYKPQASKSSLASPAPSTGTGLLWAAAESTLTASPTCRHRPITSSMISLLLVRWWFPLKEIASYKMMNSTIFPHSFSKNDPHSCENKSMATLSAWKISSDLLLLIG